MMIDAPLSSWFVMLGVAAAISSCDLMVCSNGASASGTGTGIAAAGAAPDVATDTYDREFSVGLASNERQSLYELSDALKKIEDGTYGFCESCKSLIAKNRLKAVPYARMCVKCQEKKEKR